MHGCPELVDRGRCPTHTRQAERRRGSARERGYDKRHEARFRRKVLEKHPICQLCKRDFSVHADHWPLSRRELVERGLDPYDPQYGRGLCTSDHSKETAIHQPGGWAAK